MKFRLKLCSVEFVVPTKQRHESVGIRVSGINFRPGWQSIRTEVFHAVLSFAKTDIVSLSGFCPVLGVVKLIQYYDSLVLGAKYLSDLTFFGQSVVLDDPDIRGAASA